MNKDIIFIKAPSILGLRPSGVELLPDALEHAGLIHRLQVIKTKTVFPPAYNPVRDKTTKILNPAGIAKYSVKLANTLVPILKKDQFPLVVGGDCSILLGNMLALKRLGRFGLFFLDGHADFYQSSASPTGEAADMDLALVSGRGPNVITNLEKRKPFVRDEDIVLFGQRDKQETVNFGSQQVSQTKITVLELKAIKQKGLGTSIDFALSRLLKNPIKGFWIHLDADVLDGSVMPAVDYKLPGGLKLTELTVILSRLLSSDKAMGMDITILNPKLDKNGKIVKTFLSALTRGFRQNNSNLS